MLVGATFTLAYPNRAKPGAARTMITLLLFFFLVGVNLKLVAAAICLPYRTGAIYREWGMTVNVHKDHARAHMRRAQESGRLLSC